VHFERAAALLQACAGAAAPRLCLQRKFVSGAKKSPAKQMLRPGLRCLAQSSRQRLSIFCRNGKSRDSNALIVLQASGRWSCSQWI
jgi:hypothetical protein